MALSQQQAQIARFLYSLATSRGASPRRALEFVNAAYSESGLNPSIRNKSSGATGLFQLLSSGYVNKANAMGGTTNPKANALAILPNYLSYWRSHPNAAPGQAAAAVEASGEGAGFYSGALGQLQQAVRGAGSTPLMSTTGGQQAAGPAVGNPRAALASALIAANQATSRGQPADYSQLGQLVQAARQPAASVASPPGATTPMSGAAGGPPTGGPSLAFLSPLAKQFGLQITSTTGGNHVAGSYHYQRRAEDYGGNPQHEAALQRYALSRPRQFKEVFYTGPGAAPYFVKNGRVYPVALLDKSVAQNHRDHVHLAR